MADYNDVRLGFIRDDGKTLIGCSVMPRQTPEAQEACMRLRLALAAGAGEISVEGCIVTFTDPDRGPCVFVVDEEDAAAFKDLINGEGDYAGSEPRLYPESSSSGGFRIMTT